MLRSPEHQAILDELKARIEAGEIVDIAHCSGIAPQKPFAFGHLVDLGWAIKSYAPDMSDVHWKYLGPSPIRVDGRVLCCGDWSS